MTAVYPVRMKMVVNNMVGLSVMMKHPMCLKSCKNPGHPADKSFKMSNAAKLNIGLSYQLNVSAVNTVHIVNQRSKAEMRGVAEWWAQIQPVSVEVIPLEECGAGYLVNL